jgi:hypothetical protein
MARLSHPSSSSCKPSLSISPPRDCNPKMALTMMMIHTGQALLLFGEDGLPTTLAKQLVIRRIRTAHDGLLVSSSLVVKKNYGICRAEVCGSALESEERASWQKGNVHGVVIVIITAVVVVRWWWCGGGCCSCGGLGCLVCLANTTHHHPPPSIARACGPARSKVRFLTCGRPC